MDPLVEGFLDWLSKHTAQEQTVITSAPAAFAACVVLVGVILWFVMNWWFHHDISTRDNIIRIHEERHKQKDERLADFIAKVERSSPEQLSAQISKLRANLEHATRREVTPAQGKTLTKALKVISRELHVPISFNPVNSEAEEYAKQIYGYSSGFLHFFPTNDVPMELEGIFIQVKNTLAIPEHARQLSSALNAAGIDHEIIARKDWSHLGTMRDDYCDLTIGRKKSF